MLFSIPCLPNCGGALIVLTSRGSPNSSVDSWQLRKLAMTFCTLDHRPSLDNRVNASESSTSGAACAVGEQFDCFPNPNPVSCPSRVSDFAAWTDDLLGEPCCCSPIPKLFTRVWSESTFIVSVSIFCSNTSNIGILWVATGSANSSRGTWRYSYCFQSTRLSTPSPRLLCKLRLAWWRYVICNQGNYLQRNVQENIDALCHTPDLPLQVGQLFRQCACTLRSSSLLAGLT